MCFLQAPLWTLCAVTTLNRAIDVIYLPLYRSQKFPIVRSTTLFSLYYSIYLNQ